MKSAAIYVRVSTPDQELENQIRDLTAYSQKNNWKIYNTYSDIVTGQETREDKRPGFDNLFKDAHKRLFDIVLFWDLSRFSRAGTLYTLQKLQELKNLNIDWVSYQESYFSSLGQFSDVVISIMSTLAKLEREKISERTKAGLRRAIAEGKIIGRPRIPDEIRNKVKQLLESGTGIRETARTFNVSPAFVSGIRDKVKIKVKRKAEKAAAEDLVKSDLRSVKISYKDGVASDVQIAGEFNNWQPEAMEKVEQNLWQKNLQLKVGRYKYKIVVNGSWVGNPDGENSGDEFRNSIIAVC